MKLEENCWKSSRKLMEFANENEKFLFNWFNGKGRIYWLKWAQSSDTLHLFKKWKNFFFFIAGKNIFLLKPFLLTPSPTFQQQKTSSKSKYNLIKLPLSDSASIFTSTQQQLIGKNANLEFIWVYAVARYHKDFTQQPSVHNKHENSVATLIQ